MATTFLVGELVSWTLTSASTGVLTLPDGTTTNLTTSGSGSTHTATHTTTQAGRHTLVWTSGTAKSADVLDVWPVDPHFLVSVDDAAVAVKHGGAATAAVRDALPLYIAAATAVIEDITGPLIKGTRSETFDGGRNAVLLPDTGVSVTSVTVDGTAQGASTYVVDTDAGIIYAGNTGLGYFSGGRRSVVVAYAVGAAQVPPAARLACLEQIKYLWQVTRQGATREDLGYTPSGFAVPRMVAELAATVTVNTPGFA